MKIKESKYYRPIYWLAVNDDTEMTIEFKDKNTFNSGNQPFFSLLESLMSHTSLKDTGLVIQKEKLKDFVKCTDFQTAKYSSKYNKVYESEICYFHPELEIFMLLNYNLSDEYGTQVFEEGFYQVTCLFYENTNPKCKENIEHLITNHLEKYTSKDAKVSILLKESYGFDLKTHTIKPYRIDLDTMYNNDFLEVHSHIKHTITNENKGIVLLHGVAGSGKTNYIKWLTSQIPNKKFIFIPTTMISYLTDPSFIGILVENQNSVLVLEDCENYIAERTTLNSNTDVVSSILNIADGMLSDVLECQLICTFNSDISKIDSALLREGRLIAEYKFKKLSAEKCNQYLQSVGKDMIVKEEYSLAEITNVDFKPLREKFEERRIGF